MSSIGLARTREWQLSLPLALFFAFFFVSPLLLMALLSLYSNPQWEAMGLHQYRAFFGDAFNLGVLWDTIRLGLLTTVFCLVLGLPLALAFDRAPARLKSVLIFLIVMPILTSVVVRTFAWLVILGRTGIVNTVLQDIGLAAAPIRFLASTTGVVLALGQIQMPLMVLPLITSLGQIPRNLDEASQSLGAGAWRGFFRVTLPLCLPGIVAGSLLVFAASTTAFVTQSVIGGGRLIYMPEYIYQQAISLQNWPFAAAVSIIFTLSIVGIMFVFNRLSQAKVGSA